MGHMTAIEYERAGVRFSWDGKVTGPKGDDELFAKLRADVLERVPSMRFPVGYEERGTSRCDICKDPMHIGRGGWCSLCTKARRIALKRMEQDGEA